MKNVLSDIFALVLVVTCLAFSAQGNQAPVKNKTQNGTQISKDAGNVEDPKISPVIALILNNIISAKLDLEVDLTTKTRVVDGKENTILEFRSFSATALVPFRDGFNYKFVPDSKSENPVKDVIPYIAFSAKNLQLVVRADIKEKGKLSVRFCDSYTLQNDFCNTQGDTKLLEAILKSDTFSEMFRVKLKQIDIEFDKNIGGSRFAFKGTCDAFKSGLDSSVNSVMKKVDCAFGGEFDAEAKTKDLRFRFK